MFCLRFSYFRGRDGDMGVGTCYNGYRWSEAGTGRRGLGQVIMGTDEAKQRQRGKGRVC